MKHLQQSVPKQPHSNSQTTRQKPKIINLSDKINTNKGLWPNFASNIKHI